MHSIILEVLVSAMKSLINLILILNVILGIHGCCDKLYFGSTGSLAQSEHSHIIGVYNKIDQDGAGRSIYLQEGGIPSYLYHISELGEKVMTLN